MTIIDYALGNADLMGSFEHSLCKAWTLASESNKRRLETAFPQHFPTDMMYFGTHDFRDYPSKEEWRTAYEEHLRAQNMTPYEQLKTKYPDRILLIRVGDFYETYEDSAKVIAQLLGITLIRQDGTGKEMAGFPSHALDAYLPKLIRAGYKVAICDNWKNPNRREKTITELV